VHRGIAQAKVFPVIVEIILPFVTGQAVGIIFRGRLIRQGLVYLKQADYYHSYNHDQKFCRFASHRTPPDLRKREHYSGLK
jgi:hypothetical protein